MHVRDACISACGPIAKKDVERDGRAVRLAQIVGYEKTGHVSANTNVYRLRSIDLAGNRP
jgi:hypothetical protein